MRHWHVTIIVRLTGEFSGRNDREVSTYVNLKLLIRKEKVAEMRKVKFCNSGGILFLDNVNNEDY
jgi:hypothetical protein